MLRTIDPYIGPKTEGIDVSFYQRVIDWPRVAASGVKFAICRVGDGGSKDLDSTFKRNYQGARAAGLIVGSYMFMRPLVNIQAQAKKLIDALSAVGFASDDLPPMLDVERGDDPDQLHNPQVVHDWKHVATQMLDYNSMVSLALKRKKMICYAGAFFAGQIHDVRLADLPLCTPYYGHAQAAIPKQWVGRGGWTFWQYDSSHTVPGVLSGGPVDHDVFRGDITALKDFIKQSHISA